jgi:hypothetical protein
MSFIAPGRAPSARLTTVSVKTRAASVSTAAAKNDIVRGVAGAGVESMVKLG